MSEERYIVERLLIVKYKYLYKKFFGVKIWCWGVKMLLNGSKWFKME